MDKTDPKTVAIQYCIVLELLLQILHGIRCSFGVGVTPCDSKTSSMPTAHPRTTVAFAISLLRLRAVRGKNESIGKKSFMSDSWGKTKGSVSGPCHLQAAPNPANGATGIKAFAKQTKTGQDTCGLSEHVYLISSYTRVQWHEYFVVIFSTNDISTRPYVFGPGTRWHRYVY